MRRPFTCFCVILIHHHKIKTKPVRNPRPPLNFISLPQPSIITPPSFQFPPLHLLLCNPIIINSSNSNLEPRQQTTILSYLVGWQQQQQQQMMRWGRKKSSSSSSKPSFLSHVPLLSWLSKFRHMSVNTEASDEKLKQKGPPKSSLSVSSSQYACGVGGGMSLNNGDDDDDDGFWRVPFGEETHERKTSKDTLEPELSNLEDDDDLVVQVSSCSNGGWDGRKQEKEKEIGTEEESKFPEDRKISLEIDDYEREQELDKLRRTFEKKAQKSLHERLLKLEKVTDKAESASAKSAEKDVIQLESPSTICTPRKNSLVPSLASKNPSHGSIKTRETQSSEGKLKKTTRKPKHSTKMRVYSPRMGSKTEVCKIKALEDLKKEKVRKKKTKKEKERTTMERTEVSDSFAVVRCSMNPEKDFRDSMVEMITELHIHQPEEYEELLTCYLTLNSDEYHDLIIKVFREVWFDMNKDLLGISLHKQYVQA